MNTPIISNLIPRLKEHAAAHLLAYLEKGGELCEIMEDIERWYDSYRDKDHPELPMWSDLPSPDRDALFDAWIEAMEDFFSKRITKSKPVPVYEPVRYEKRDDGLIHQAPCPACGIVGVHFCTGGQTSHPGWSATDQSLPVSSHAAASSATSPLSGATEEVKTSPGASVCEVEPLGDVSSGRDGELSFKDYTDDLCRLSPNEYGIDFVLCDEVAIAFSRNQIISLIAHLSAWVETGSFRLVPRETGSESQAADQSLLLREAREALDKANKSLSDLFSGSYSIPDQISPRLVEVKLQSRQLLSKIDAALGQ